MKYPTKRALLDDIRTEHRRLIEKLAAIPPSRWREAGVWGDGWSVADLVAHLAEWHRLFLGWYEAGLRGAVPQMPAAGYKWSETPRLNRAIHEKHRSRSVKSIRADFDSTHVQLVTLVQALAPAQLLTPGHFAWTGRYPLTTYLGPNTASHYRFAIKVIKRWLKGTTRSSEGTMRAVARPGGLT